MPPPPSLEPVKAADTTLYLEIILNQIGNGPIMPVEQRGKRFMMAAHDLRALGLKIPEDSDGDIALDSIAGVKLRYDSGAQRLTLDVPPALLPVQRFERAKQERMRSESGTGFVVSYDAFAQRAAGMKSFAVWSEQRFFAPMGVISNTGNLRLAGGNKGYLRYDTRYTRVDEDRALNLNVGDIVSGALPWSTAVRMGGIQLARNFRMRPDLVLTPLPQFAGQAAVPSAVDLFINGRRSSTETVKPGPFVLNDLPSISGAGRATVVTTDALGRQVATTIPFYVAHELLRPGLSDFSIEAGVMRRNYGIRSFSYGTAAASGVVRYGLNRRLTIEGHAEASSHVSVAGLGAIIAPGRLGVVNVAMAFSKSAQGTGRQTTVGYSYSGPKFGVSWQHQERTANFQDLGSFDLSKFSRAHRSDNVVATLGFDRAGSVGLGYIDAKSAYTGHTQLVTASYSVPVRKGANLFVSADADLKHGGVSAQLRFMLSLGRNGVAAGVNRSRDGEMLYQLDYNRSIPADGGLGLNANVARGSSGRELAQLQTVMRGSHAEFVAGASTVDGQKSIWAGASGSIVAMAGGVYTAPQIGEAFALVSTDAPNVPVIYENQIVGRTDRSGHRLIAGVTPHQPVRYAIDPVSLSSDLLAPLIERRVAVRSGGGALVKIPVIPSRAISLILTDSAGQPLGIGGAVKIAGQESPAVIGWDGIIYLENPPTGGRVDVLQTNGKSCSFEFPAAAAVGDRVICS